MPDLAKVGPRRRRYADAAAGDPAANPRHRSVAVSRANLKTLAAFEEQRRRQAGVSTNHDMQHTSPTELVQGGKKLREH